MAGGDKCMSVSSVKGNVNLGYSNKKDVKNSSTYQSSEKKDKKQVEKSYGAWGPTFKNKDHFASMHLC